MSELILDKEIRMTSLEVVELINNFRREEGNEVLKKHDDMLKSIRKEMEALKNAGIKDVGNFSETTYKDSYNRNKPCYKINKAGIMQMLNKESALVRYKTQQYIEALENKVKEPQLTVKQQLQLAILNGDEIERISSLKAYETLVVEEATKPLVEEIERKEDVIVGLVDDIDLCTKRQRINQIIRYGAKGRYMDRWSLLYSEFEKKYHVDIKRRMKNCEIKPKIKNKMDYIDRVMNMTSQLYELSCKLFENEVERLKEEWIETIER